MNARFRTRGICLAFAGLQVRRCELPGRRGPNNDTFYSSAWVDLKDGPVILSHPDLGSRYFIFQFADIDREAGSLTRDGCRSLHAWSPSERVNAISCFVALPTRSCFTIPMRVFSFCRR